MAIVKLTTAPDLDKQTIIGTHGTPTITFEIPDPQLNQFIYFFSCVINHADAILPAAMAIADCLTCTGEPQRAA